MKVDIWSDVQCPWCYIGKRKFEDGAAEFGGDVEVEYHSFELSPDTPTDFQGGEADYLARHKGISSDHAQQMLERVTGVAAGLGLAETGATTFVGDTAWQTAPGAEHQVFTLVAFARS